MQRYVDYVYESNLMYIRYLMWKSESYEHAL